MKAEIDATGVMTITPETPPEAYALRRWKQEGADGLSTGILFCNVNAPLPPRAEDQKP